MEKQYKQFTKEQIKWLKENGFIKNIYGDLDFSGMELPRLFLENCTFKSIDLENSKGDWLGFERANIDTVNLEYSKIVTIYSEKSKVDYFYLNKDNKHFVCNDNTEKQEELELPKHFFKEKTKKELFIESLTEEQKKLYEELEGEKNDNQN